MAYMPELTEKQLPDSKYFYTVSFLSTVTVVVGTLNSDARLVQQDHLAPAEVAHRFGDLSTVEAGNKDYSRHVKRDKGI